MLRKKSHSTTAASGSFDHPYNDEEGNYVTASNSGDSYGYLSRSISSGNSNGYHPYYSYSNIQGPPSNSFQTPTKNSTGLPTITAAGSGPRGNGLPPLQSLPVSASKKSHGSSSFRRTPKNRSCLKITCYTLIISSLVLLIFIITWKVPFVTSVFNQYLPAKVSLPFFDLYDNKQSNGDIRLKVYNLEQKIMEKDQTIDHLTSKLREMDRLKVKEDSLKNQIHHVHEAIAKESRRAVLSRFGADTLHVTMFLDVPWQTAENTHVSFTVAMHSLDYMPHSVHMFVEQVDHGLWDNTYFTSNAPHILFISPIHILDSIPLNIAQVMEFQDLGLSHLLFQEYHVNYPHKPMTLGFSGRPAGPQFYINKIDNTVAHGPGGQAHNLKPDEEADPCFATVVSGKEILTRIFTLPVKQGSDYILFEPVRIIRAVLHSEHEAVEMDRDGSLHYVHLSLDSSGNAHDENNMSSADGENSNIVTEQV